jgi:acyl carrier protein
MPAEIGRMLVHDRPTRTAVVLVRPLPALENTMAVTIATPSGRPLVEFEELRFAVLAPDDRAVIATAPIAIDPASVLGEVRLQVAAEARLAPERLSLDKPLVELGLDSVMISAVRRRLERTYGVPVPATLLWQRPTVAAVADYLLAELAVFDS